jgi:hypothetical protein
MSERDTQSSLAAQRGDGRVWLFNCHDGETFSAVASTESGAFRVLNAERPGIHATFGVPAPCIPPSFRW